MPAIIILLVAVLWLTTAGSHAQATHERAGEDEFNFITLSPYARPAGLAGAYTALAEGADAQGSNPAGLAYQKRQRRKSQVSASFKRNFLEVHAGEVSFVMKGTGPLWYAAGVNYINHGIIKELNSRGEETGKDIMAYSTTPVLSAAALFFSSLQLGASFKMPTEYLGDMEGSLWALGWGVDLGAQYRVSKSLRFGAAMLNAGRKEMAHFEGSETGGALPLELKAGMAYRPRSVKGSHLIMDLGFPFHDFSYIAGGMEHDFSRRFTVRFGSRINFREIRFYYRDFVLSESGLMQPGSNALKLAAGFTLNQRRFLIDYAAQYWRWIGMAHLVTFKWRV